MPLLFLAFAFICLGRPAMAQPANDSFANPTTITGPSGSVSGSNVGASLESGEPSLAGNPGGQSVWFQWTAPSDMTVTFNTVGSDFDTLLGVFTGNTVDALTLIQDNDNANGTLQSSVTIAASAGTTYFISVDGYNAGGGASQGIITLNWGPGSGAQLAAGSFRFTSSYYLFSESEDFGPEAANMRAVPARLTITRDFGSAGRVLVAYTVTNGLYTNISQLSITGTNIYTTNFVGSTNFFTNYYYTNIVAIDQYQDFQYGVFRYLAINNLTNIAITNINNTLLSSITFSNDVGTNIPAIVCAPMTNVTITTDTNFTPPAMLVVVTNVFCTSIMVTNIVPSAEAFTDYLPQSSVIAFNDYQMSSNIFVDVFPDFSFFLTPFLNTLLVNKMLIATIDNVSLDPLESPSIAPPTTSGSSSSLVGVMRNLSPVFVRRVGDGDVAPHLFMEGRLGTNVFNFERATLRCSRNVAGADVARIYVIRTSLDYSSGTSVNYRIDHLKVNNIADEANDIFSFFGDEIPLQAGSEYALPSNPFRYGIDPDFESVTGTLNWGANDGLDKPIDIPITNYNKVEFNEDFLVELYFPEKPDPEVTTKALGYVHTAVVTILFNDIDTNIYANLPNVQPAGAVDRFHNMDNYSATTPPYNLHPGANSTVFAVAVQPDGKAVFAGDFTAYNTVPRYRVARSMPDGQIDLTFDPKDGADRFVTSLLLDGNGNIYVGGAFSSFNRTARNGIARLKPDGSLDTSFFPGQGANGTVWATAFHTNASIIIAGEFTTFNGLPRQFIARVGSDGSLDPSFDPGPGPDGPIYAIAVQPDRKILIGGAFNTVGGVSRPHIARLNADGSLDSTFDPGFGADDVIYALALQLDGRILIGGAFHTVAAQIRNSIARLNPNGTPDQTFDPGQGADDTVYSLNVLIDGKILVGGIFRQFNQTRRVGLVRLFPWGPVDTSFMDTAYNQFAGLPTHYWSADAEPRGFIFSSAVQPDGNIIIGGGFTEVGGGFARDDIRQRNNVARIIGGSTPGPGNIELAQSSYSADQIGSQLFVPLMRTNGNLGPASVSVVPSSTAPGPGSAVDNQDFVFDSASYGRPTYESSYWFNTTGNWAILGGGTNNFLGLGTWQLQDGTFGQNQGFTETVDPQMFEDYTLNDVYITILNNTNTSGNRQLQLKLSNPSSADIFYLGGENIPLGLALGRSLAPLTLVDPHTSAGVLGFSATNYIVSEAGNAVITITRTNGSAGLATVKYATANGTATNGVHYRAVSGQLTFLPGETNKTFTVPIIDEAIKEGDHTVLLSLSSPSGSATIGLANAVLTIIDNDIVGGYVQFSSATYGTNENAVYAQVTVNRNGGGAGELAAWFTARNGSALSGFNFIGVTNQLIWVNGDVQPKTVPIPIFADGVPQTSPLTINLRLSSATVNGITNTLSIGSPNSAVLFLTNSDFSGLLSFSTPVYSVNENGGPAIITVVRRGGTAGIASINFSTLPGSATPGVDFLSTNGTLSFGVGEVSKSFTVPIINNTVQDPARFITLSLTGASPTNTFGSPSTAILNIVDDESLNQPPGSADTTLDPSVGFNGSVQALIIQPDGKLLAGGDFTTADGFARNRIARLNPDGSLDNGFSSTATNAGANDTVLALLTQSDRRILVGGRFSAISGATRNFLARLNADGTIDTTFNPGSGPDNTVFALAETFDNGSRKLLVGGAFPNYNTIPTSYLTRLNNDGTLDSSFNTGFGLDGAVVAIALQPDGKIVIGGDFTSVNGTARYHIARLNPKGSLDLSFDPGAGASDSVRAIAIQADGRIVIGGSFDNINGVTLHHIARLNADGTVDNTFNPGLGANDLVTSITMQPDTRIILGGQFTLCNGVTRGRITRLNNDGTQDTMINFGTGANSFVSATQVQTNGAIVLAGGFTEYDGQARNRFARIYGGTISGSGSLEFDSPIYEVDEDATNTVVTIRRRGGTSGPASAPNGTISVNFNTSDGSAKAGINYRPVSTNFVFPAGEVVERVTIPVIRDFAITTNLTVNLKLSNPQPPDGPTLGNATTAQLFVDNVDSAVTFSSPIYSAPENALSGFALISVLRSGSTTGPASVDFFTTTNGTALPNTNYIPTTNTISFASGQYSNFVTVPLIHDPRAQGNRTVVMQLTNALNALLFNPSTATLTIVDIDRVPGQFIFAQTNYVVSEGAGKVVVNVIRTNGHTGVVTVNYGDAPGSALPGIKYVSTNGVLTFADGETNKSIAVGIIDNNQVEGDQTFSVVLSNPTGGASIFGSDNVPVTILDNDIGVSFSSPVYVAPESDSSITIGINRVGTNGVTTVSYASTNGTAVAGTNYIAVSGSLSFASGESFKTLAVPLLHDPRVTGPLSFTLGLYNPSGPARIYANNPATVTINDADAGFAFTNSTFYTVKSGTNILISVLRSNANTGIVSVHYTTEDGTAKAGVDYVASSGVLTFSNGIALQSFTVPIINNQLVEGDTTFNLNLVNPSPGSQLVPPSSATVTITNDLAGLSFSSPAYSVNENGVSALITVVRSGFTTNTVSVDYLTSDGTGKAGVNYRSVSGTFTFTNGETVKTFSVPVIDNGVPDGDRTVLVSLRNPVGKGVVVAPSAATLTIVETDGSLIVPAGTALTSESGPVNGMIDSGERVGVLFAFRNATGTNTANLIATLLATNGISNPSAPQSYGVLTVHGPAVSRPFTFTADGTNGQVITATFQLRDGNAPTNIGVVSFVVGRTANTYSNTAPIVINDATAASPYPSIINVSGLPGAVNGTIVMLTNINHTWPRDIDVMLVSPSGQKTYLMAKAGGSFAVNNLTLTFDDAAPTLLPQSTLLVSSTNRPSCYAVVPPPFPVPAPVGPASTNLAVFNGSNPNGPWSLYVFDDTLFNSGVISNGWVLNLLNSHPILGDADLGVYMSAAPDPVIAGTPVTYSLTVTNYGPGNATNVLVSASYPPNVAFVSATPGVGTATNSAGQITWSFNSLAQGATASLSMILRPPAAGFITNSAVVSADSSDLNPEDDTAVSVVTAVAPTSDLAIALTDTPDPVLSGHNLTYNITVLNLGPAVANAVSVTDTLPPGVGIVSVSPAAFTFDGSTVSFPNLGDLASGDFLTATIVVTPLVGGTLTNTVTCSSTLTDPLKLNNTASVKTDVQAVLLNVVHSNGTLVFSWPVDAAGYYLESAADLTAPITWARVTSPPPVQSGSVMTVTLPVGPGTGFFRLHGQGQ
ncbi:MAG TPA: Calx-beta domain-containing protein [Candidatus Limnocylindrales bacterium]|nr:Calx-beta domain-containing protein [Candidatus Limnocylindrales bacterium]